MLRRASALRAHGKRTVFEKLKFYYFITPTVVCYQRDSYHNNDRNSRRGTRENVKNRFYARRSKFPREFFSTRPQLADGESFPTCSNEINILIFPVPPTADSSRTSSRQITMRNVADKSRFPV